MFPPVSLPATQVAGVPQTRPQPLQPEVIAEQPAVQMTHGVFGPDATTFAFSSVEERQLRFGPLEIIEFPCQKIPADDLAMPFLSWR